MVLHKVWCEFDMGWNVDDNTGVYSDGESLTTLLEQMDWKQIDDEFETWEDVEEAGLLSLTRIKG